MKLFIDLREFLDGSYKRVWDGSGLVMSCKRLEQNSFKWPKVTDGVMRLDPAQFEALFAGLDWRRVTAREVTPPPVAAE